MQGWMGDSTRINGIADRASTSSCQCFAEDAVFQDAQGQIYRSRAAIKGAFSHCSTDPGEVNFDWPESIIDEDSNKPVVTCTMSMSPAGSMMSVKGLDISIYGHPRMSLALRVGSFLWKALIVHSQSASFGQSSQPFAAAHGVAGRPWGMPQRAAACAVQSSSRRRRSDPQDVVSPGGQRPPGKTKMNERITR
jgi:hypothetical protein